jgi:hypothetical protein
MKFISIEGKCHFQNLNESNEQANLLTKTLSIFSKLDLSYFDIS